jgi:hypothetical protein
MEDAPQNPFATLIPTRATAEDLDNDCKSLEADQKNELEEHKKFRSKKQSANVLSRYCQRHIRLHVDPDYPARALNFDD